jgi:hypothetical protein
MKEKEDEHTLKKVELASACIVWIDLDWFTQSFINTQLSPRKIKQQKKNQGTQGNDDEILA